MPLGSQTITRLRATSEEDEYHNAVESWVTPSELAFTGCSVQPGGGTESNDSRTAITTLFTVWAPVSADVLDTDRIRFAGTVYDIDGSVDRWEVGSDLDHLVIRLKAVNG